MKKSSFSFCCFTRIASAFVFSIGNGQRNGRMPGAKLRAALKHEDSDSGASPLLSKPAQRFRRQLLRLVEFYFFLIRPADTD